MTKYSFGSGQLFAVPASGAPLRFGAVQDVSIDISGDVKMLYGQEQFALANARGRSKIEGKFGSGQIDVDAYNTFFFGQTVVAGHIRSIRNEAASVPAASTYTVTAANGANFEQDLGVFYAATGQPLRQVASAPTAGQYTINQTTGVYTFSSADASAAVLLNYLYKDTTNGRRLDIANTLMGAIPTFQVVLAEKFQGKDLTIKLYSCVSDKLSLPFKQDDFAIADIGFMAQADAAGRIGYISHG